MLATLSPPAADDLEDWQQIRELLAGAVSETHFDVWLSPLELIATDSQTLLLRASPHVAGFTAERFSRVLSKCAAGVGRDIAIASEAQVLAMTSRQPQFESAQPSRSEF